MIFSVVDYLLYTYGEKFPIYKSSLYNIIQFRMRGSRIDTLNFIDELIRIGYLTKHKDNSGRRYYKVTKKGITYVRNVKIFFVTSFITLVGCIIGILYVF